MLEQNSYPILHTASIFPKRKLLNKLIHVRQSVDASPNDMEDLFDEASTPRLKKAVKEHFAYISENSTTIYCGG